jgi:hypothetical protein
MSSILMLISQTLKSHELTINVDISDIEVNELNANVDISDIEFTWAHY